jgi:hypothetical protein
LSFFRPAAGKRHADQFPIAIADEGVVFVFDEDGGFAGEVFAVEGGGERDAVDGEDGLAIVFRRVFRAC